jgi:HK97 family phage portal protein
MKLFGRKEKPAASPIPWTEIKDRSFDEILRLMFSREIAAGINVTPKSALRNTTVHAIVRALTNAIATYPVGVYQLQYDDDGKETRTPLPNHNVSRILRRPNKRLTQAMFFRRCILHVSLWGNFLAVKVSGVRGPISALNPISPESYTVVNDDELNPVIDVHFSNGTRRYSGNQLLIVNGILHTEGVLAESPIDKAAEAIGLAMAAERMLSQLYGNGAVPGFLLTGGRFASEEQYETWVNKFRQVYGQNGSNRGGVAMLPEGMEAKTLTFAPADAQLLETRKFQRQEIASVYGVPLHKLADLERATFSNIEHQGLEFLQDVMLPFVRNIEEALERDCLTEADQRAGVAIRFDMDAGDRADFKSRTESYSKMHSIGAMSPNEIRAREGMNPREGGDEFVTPMNMRPSGEDEDVERDNEDDAESDDSGTEAEAALRSV